MSTIADWSVHIESVALHLYETCNSLASHARVSLKFGIVVCELICLGEENESLKVKFDIIVPGSQTIHDVSLLKPGYHFYNILPLDQYKSVALIT